MALADAARGRSRADWLVGMNLSRAYSLTYGEDLSVGRVQTPTLAMLVERELAIRRFVPEDYMEVVATFHPQGRPADNVQGHVAARPEARADDKESLAQSMRLPADGEEAGRIVDAGADGSCRDRVHRSARRSGCRRRRSTTSLSCSATPTACSAAARSRRSRWRRRCTRSTS